MTENKRFRLGYVCGDYGLIDDYEWIDLHSMSENSEKNVQICINKMNELSEENEQLKGSLYAEKTNTAEVINDYSKQFKRHSKEFSFMIDLAEDLGVDVNKLEAKDD